MTYKFVVIRDEHSKLFGYRLLNSQLSLYLGSVQLFFCLWALTQHVWAMASLKKVLHCDFSSNSTLPPLLTHVDAIIFDIGLFHNLWGISGCVAQHLDGGYGRFCWCIAHSSALLFCLPLAFVSRPQPKWLWPLLIQQSAYGVGMLILSLAALPRAAHFLGDLSNAPIKAIVFYSLGTLMNFFLLFVYWHWYWHVETLWSSARKLRRGETFNGSTIKRPIQRYSPPMVGGKIPLLLGGTIMEEKPIRNGVIGGERTKEQKPKGRGNLANGDTLREGTEEERQPQQRDGRERGARQRHHPREKEDEGMNCSGGEDGGRHRPLGEDGGRHRPLGEDGGRHRPFGPSDSDTLNGISANGRSFAPNYSVDGLRKYRRKSHNKIPSFPAEGFDEENSLNAASQSFGSTTASSSASTTATKLATSHQLHPNSRKPPPPAPSPAGDSPTQWNCFANFCRLSSPNELPFPPRVRHLRREGSPQIHRNSKHWHQNAHSLCGPSARINACSFVDGPILPLNIQSVPTKPEMEEQLLSKSNRRQFITENGTTEADQMERTAKRCERRKRLRKDNAFWRTEKGKKQRQLDIEVGKEIAWRRDSDGRRDKGTPKGTETDIGRGRDTFDPKGWSPTAQSSTTTSWNSSTNEHQPCHCPIQCHSQRQKAESAWARANGPNAKRGRPIVGPINKVPLIERAEHNGEGSSSSEWSTSWTDSPTYSLQRMSPAPPALFGSSPLRMFGLSALFTPPLEHCV